ncbi:hypothetical protein [Legionella waltersii]|uniref:Uncharacterized protein n=1 Tax=Legionella waltersii TaxID=66969 RepID=A0A0W1ADP0_9GAMM|nr:hypothetical protein [Legionella waltersii]KTD79442.1 hypothetical protein Lwal_1514 [Legionella waltersii]SNU97628.1 Uncharacterised protein [Legionella waltersii]
MFKHFSSPSLPKDWNDLKARLINFPAEREALKAHVLNNISNIVIIADLVNAIELFPELKNNLVRHTVNNGQFANSYAQKRLSEIFNRSAQSYNQVRVSLPIDTWVQYL